MNEQLVQFYRDEFMNVTGKELIHRDWKFYIDGELIGWSEHHLWIYLNNYNKEVE